MILVVCRNIDDVVMPSLPGVADAGATGGGIADVSGAATVAVDDRRFRFFFSVVVCFFFVALHSTIGGVVVTVDTVSGTVCCC